MFQLEVENVSESDACAEPHEAELPATTFPSVTSRLCTGMVTVPVGATFRTTVNDSEPAAPPPSAVARVVLLTVKPGMSLSALVTATVTPGTSRYVGSRVYTGSTDAWIV